ncbi:MAG: ATP-binding cassette domain-containing protein, partial [Niabella sp.]
SKTYSGSSGFTLSNVSVQIKAGEVIGLVGENGNGKTTLLRILAKDLHYNSGEINYSFSNAATDTYELRTLLTYIPQRTPKWYGSLKDNLKFTATHYGITGYKNEQLVLMMMIRFGLWPFRNMKWSELSSGYKMRFELARTFLRNPKLLLLDEPLANLDIFAQQTILEDLKFMSQSLRNPLAIVLSSQQLYEVEKISDEVIFLKNGSPKSLKETKMTGQQVTDLIFELETTNSREELLQALAGLEIKDLQLNGGTYMITIAEIESTALLGRFSQHHINVKYYRNITHSTRRFFS